MKAVDRALLGVIAFALVALLVVTVVPGPFRHCSLTYQEPVTSGPYGATVRTATADCSLSWWP